jgi:hypothetical protein
MHSRGPAARPAIANRRTYLAHPMQLTVNVDPSDHMGPHVQ